MLGHFLLVAVLIYSKEKEKCPMQNISQIAAKVHLLLPHPMLKQGDLNRMQNYLVFHSVERTHVLFLLL